MQPSARSIWHRRIAFHSLSVCLFVVVEWWHYRALAGWGPIPLDLVEVAGLFWLLALQAWVPLTPLLLISGVALLLGRRRWSRGIYLGGWLLVITWLAVDVGCQRIVGAHLAHYLPYIVDALTAPDGADYMGFGGDPTDFVGAGLIVLLAVALVALLAHWLSGRALRLLAGRWPDLGGRRGLGIGLALVAFQLLGAVPIQVAFRRTSLLRKVHALLPLDLSASRALASRLGALVERAPSVRVVSLRVNPRGDDAGKEEVTLHNFAPASIALEGWWLQDGEGARLPLEGVLESGRSRLVRIPPRSIELRNDGGSVSLFDAGGSLRHEVGYTEDQAVGGMVINFRDEDDFDAFSRRLNAELQPHYRRIQPRWLPEHPPDPAARLPATDVLPPDVLPPDVLPPDVLIVVLESLRHDVLTAGLMPQIDAWAAGGLRLRRHYSTSNITHFGLYGLLYGRLPLFYDRDLDDGVPPQLCVTLRAAGYETELVASVPFAGWRRMEAFLNEGCFDEITVPEGDWRASEQWTGRDQALFRRVRERLRGPRERPRLIVALAFSTHYPYAFPPAFDRHRPSGIDVDYNNWMRLDRAQLLNRYRNAALFSEAELIATLEALDPARTVVIFTGDHGESLGEDGVRSHGSRPSDIQMRVPFAMVGPGVPAREINTATSHLDVLPTLLHALAGVEVPIAGAVGRDLLGPGPFADSVLLSPRQLLQPYELLMIRGTERLLFKVRLDRPQIETFGFVDARGAMDLENPVPPPPEAASEWVEQLVRVLDRMQ